MLSASAEPQADKRRLAYSLFLRTKPRWPVELQALETPNGPQWARYRDVCSHKRDAFLVVPRSINPVVFAWYSRRTVLELEQRSDLTPGSALVPLPRLQMTTSTDLLNRKFTMDKNVKNPRDWVDRTADLVVIWIEPGAPKHDGATAGTIDVLNWCETLHVPVWLACQSKWRYGPKHELHHERIDEWLETAKTFDLTG